LLGAYGGCFRTAFNGFDRARMVEVSDAPLVQTVVAEELRLAA
jgi:ornithine decarboxylase